MEKSKKCRSRSQDKSKELNLVRRLEILEQKLSRKDRDRRRKNLRSSSSSEESNHAESISISSSRHNRNRSRRLDRSRSHRRRYDDYHHQRFESQSRSPDRSSYSGESYYREEGTSRSQSRHRGSSRRSGSPLDHSPRSRCENEISDHSVSEIQPILLDQEVLQALGNRVTKDKVLGPDLHKDIVIRSKEVLRVGLPSEEKNELLNKYTLPKNCTFLEPPKLNLEVKASLPEAVITRDSRLFSKQGQLSVCLAALSSASSSLLSNEDLDKVRLLNIVSDATRLLINSQREESFTRKTLIVSHLNTSMEEILGSVDPDEWLFGNQLEERIKSAILRKRLEVQLEIVVS